MRTRKEMKKSAKHVVKTHYALLVITCLIMAFVGAQFSNSMDFVKQSVDPYSSDLSEEENGTQVATGTAASQLNAVAVIREALFGDEQVSQEQAEEIQNESKEKSEAEGANKALGRTRGVLASAINSVASGSVFITILSGLNSVSKSRNVAVILFILLSLVAMLAVWFFFQNLLEAVSCRIFMESRTYEKVPVTRFLFFYRIRKWCKASWTMFVRYMYLVFWMFTIVGGIIKNYSYKMVPYIVAENPNMKANETITLSRKMMDGHKWECFILDLSFIGWNLLNAVTFGLAGVFFINPYTNATYTEYYTELRKQAIEKNIPGYEKLNDIYLYEKAAEDILNEKYQDIVELMKQPQAEAAGHQGIQGFIANVFGIILVNNDTEKEYEAAEVRKLKIHSFKDILEEKRYPGRLYSIPEKEKRKKVETMRYLRHYTIWSVILLFFCFSLIGWLWEVSLHLVSDGVFVNRGVLHGPWLPIYGTGGVLILVVLNKFRENPVVEFIAAVILCGCVEYYTSYYLEMAHNGQKWWDYSGYFLNLNGRICAEGLLVFGLGGMAIVYLLAPMLDNYFRKIKLSILVPLCVALLCIFCVDQVYSGKHPNTGKGITDYASQVIEERPELNLQQELYF
ncbi:MAG: DUF975 family protein [Lachnospiraceae bacterium]|nr:DUF975 family protein [Lachnospiraceae bacterium]MDD3617478.1 DUF975 family protein [Lachnospiraceae bacterium]